MGGVFCSVTLFTGFPGPGPLRRDRYEELDRLVQKINAQPTLTFTDCNGKTLTYRPTARVDLVRDRVVTNTLTDMLTPPEAQLTVRTPFVAAAPECA